MENQTRRGILGVLGLSAAAVSTEALADKDFIIGGVPDYCPAMTKRGAEHQEMIAKALDNLAAAIRNHDAVAVKLETYSQTDGADFLQHTVKIDVELPVDQHDVRVDKQVARAEKMLEEARRELEAAREDRRVAKVLREQAEYVTRDKAWKA